MSSKYTPKENPNDWHGYGDTVSADGGEVLFEVVYRQVIGSVYAGHGTHTPKEAAYLIIANNDNPGVYEFPTVDGLIETVTVTRREASE